LRDEGDDADLKRMFAAARAEDRGEVTPFASVLASDAGREEVSSGAGGLGGEPPRSAPRTNDPGAHPTGAKTRASAPRSNAPAGARTPRASASPASAPTTSATARPRRAGPLPSATLAAAALGAVALIVTAALWTLLPTANEPPPIEVASALVAWRSPTGALLDTPGRSLLAETPAIGRLDLPLGGADVERPKTPPLAPLRDRKETP
jgi:hypothetical protein